MKYKLKELPEIVYWSETKQFTIIDENGLEIEIRIGESSKNIEYWIWNEPGGWDEIEDADIIDYINEIFPDDECDFESEFKKEEESKMSNAIEKFISENGEIDNTKKFDDLISELMRVQDYSKKYHERFYLAYYFVMRKIKLNVSSTNE